MRNLYLALIVLAICTLSYRVHQLTEVIETSCAKETVREEPDLPSLRTEESYDSVLERGRDNPQNRQHAEGV